MKWMHPYIVTPKMIVHQSDGWQRPIVESGWLLGGCIHHMDTVLFLVKEKCSLFGQ
jgi:hypothetical protein